jgi:hypothetical protein
MKVTWLLKRTLNASVEHLKVRGLQQTAVIETWGVCGMRMTNYRQTTDN